MSAPAHKAVGLPAMGIAAPLGIGKRRVAEAVLAGSQHAFQPREGLIAGRTVMVGAVPDPLPPVPPALAAYASRNNRLLLAALAEIEAEVAAAIHRYGARRVAVILGTSTSGIAEGEEALASRLKNGSWPAGFDYRAQEAGGAAEFLALYLGIDGPAYVVATACSSSAKVFGVARRLLRADVCDAAIVGGADSLCRLTLNGFASLAALAPVPCLPFSANRLGISIGEGAALFLMTRETAEVSLVGVGESSDAHHVSAPEPEGRGAVTAMQLALDDAGLSPADIAYLNLHGTATALNDAMESKAVATLFGTKTPCSSTKALTGHTLGAAGAIEAAFLWLVLSSRFNQERHLPPQLWDGAQDPTLAPIHLVALGTQYAAAPRTAMLTNSFAFGGSNCSLVLGRGW